MIERGGAQNSTLAEVVADSTNLMLEQNNRLSLGVIAALSADRGGNMDEVLAALDLMERIANVSRSLLETRGDAIFGKNGSHSTSFERREEDEAVSIDIESVEQSKGTEVVGPKTFGELLDSKIDQFLPDNKKSFKKKELYNLLNNKNGTKKAIVELGYDKRKIMFTRDEAAPIVRAIAIGGRIMTKPKERYDRAQIAASIFPKSRNLLNDYSLLVGHDWKADPEVDEKTFWEIRGIVQMDKLLKKQNVALQESTTSLD